MDQVIAFIDWHMAWSVAIGVAVGYATVKLIGFIFGDHELPLLTQ
ncbi:MAG: hypothetical protein JWN85_2316 [Gammaproteobacteria bacterium]|nr:hypothetical protein [Gammaproteobacteria bacterium]